MMAKSVKQLFPYNAKSITEFIEKVDKYSKIKVVACISDKTKVLNKNKPRYDMSHRYSTQFQALTPEGRPINLTIQYSYNGERAVKNTINTLEHICKCAPNLKPRLRNSDGRELTDGEYLIIRAYAKNI
ncbi:MAG: hypothetical protein ACP5NW_01610 [Candidatus Woesearchaeota archaeon]